MEGYDDRRSILYGVTATSTEFIQHYETSLVIRNNRHQKTSFFRPAHRALAHRAHLGIRRHARVLREKNLCSELGEIGEGKPTMNEYRGRVQTIQSAPPEGKRVRQRRENAGADAFQGHRRFLPESRAG